MANSIQFDRKISLGNLFTLAAVCIAVALWYFRVDAHTTNGSIHHEEADLLRTYALKDDVEKDLDYLRQRVDQLARHHQLPEIKE